MISKILLVVAIVVGLLFIYIVFFAKKEQKKEHMNGKIINCNVSWCGHCKKFKPTWNEFKKRMASNGSNIEVVDLQCDLNEENEQKCKELEVAGYPTVLFMNSNGERKEYSGDRTIESLVNFVNGK
jgi:thiol-disulfide isomerase/thioredoxin